MAGPDSGGDPDPYLAHHDLIEQAIRTFCRRQRLSATEAEDFASEVRLHLLDRERAVLRAFEGRSSFQTYLLTVIRHQFRDWRNALWGKWRPSAEARRLGPLAVRLEMLLVRDRLPLDRRWTFQLNKQRPPRRLGPRALADQVSFEMPLDAAFDYALALTAGGTRLTPEIELPRDASTTVTIVNR
ncbi:MAG TPA: hypothetical protein VMM93_00260, partial [Vicinamibacterales bacterium]|nr:hypothetical protein [Vicinamibacterales bacterium]